MYLELLYKSRRGTGAEEDVRYDQALSRQRMQVYVEKVVITESLLSNVAMKLSGW